MYADGFMAWLNDGLPTGNNPDSYDSYDNPDNPDNPLIDITHVIFNLIMITLITLITMITLGRGSELYHEALKQVPAVIKNSQVHQGVYASDNPRKIS